MIYRHDKAAKASMNALNRQLPVVETEFKREEAPRRLWDRYSPPDYDYVNRWLGKGGKKRDNFDMWDLTQEDFCIATAGERDGYAYFYNNRVGRGLSCYVGAAMLVWADTNHLGRNSASENCRTSGRVDPVRIPKESFYALQVFQAESPRIKILGHWNYPPLTEETYRYREKEWAGDHWRMTDKFNRRDPRNKTVYVLGSLHCSAIELFVNGKSAGVNAKPENAFVYAFPNIDVTQSGEIRAVARDAAGKIVAEDNIETVGEPVALRLLPVTGPKGLLADGSDVMFFDVLVVDAKGRVCPLNYDRIDFKLEGPGVFLGGYNSGKFGNDSVIHKNYLFAECGRNRVFIRSTRTPGEIVVTASSGKLQTRETVRSAPVTVTDGFAPPQQSRQGGVQYRSVTASAERQLNGSVAAATKPFQVFVNGQPVAFPGDAPYVPDSSTGVVCPLRPVLAALEKAGAVFRWDYREDGALPGHLAEYSLPLLTIRAGNRKVELANGNTEIVLNDGKGKNLTNFQFIESRGELVGELPAVLAYLPGVEMRTDTEDGTVNITVKKP